jgi:hypothetical protein
MQPTTGHLGLSKAIHLWDDNYLAFKAYKDGDLLIEPRIEVIIPFTVTPCRVFPQEEDRVQL